MASDTAATMLRPLLRKLRPNPSLLPDGVVDLTELAWTGDWLGSLLEGPHDWRHRVVEELVFGSGAHVRVTSAFQVRLRDVLPHGTDLRGARRARMILPIATRAKRPLLNLDITGSEGATITMVTRSESSALQARYLQQLIRSSPVRYALADGLTDDLLKAICIFTPDRWRNYRAKRLRWPGDDQAIADYLRGGTDGVLTPSRADVRRWRVLTEEAGTLLATALQQKPSIHSSADEVLLAIPDLAVLPSSVTAVNALVTQYHRAVTAAAAADRLFLGNLAEYGRRYEVMVRTEVPLDEPFIIKLSEDRSLRLRRGWSRQRFAINDAGRAHLEARFVDASVRFAKYRLLRPDGEKLGNLESQRQTGETLALYTSDDRRPPWADVRLKIRPARSIALVASLLTVLNVLSVIVVLNIDHADEHLLDRLAILTVPTTLAAAFFLTREQTALAQRVTVVFRVVVALTTLVLWCAVLYWVDRFHPEPAPNSVKTSSAAVAQLPRTHEARTIGEPADAQQQCS